MRRTNTNKSDNNQLFSPSSSRTHPGKNDEDSSNNNNPTDRSIIRRSNPFPDLNKSFRLRNMDSGLSNLNSQNTKATNLPTSKIPRPIGISTRNFPTLPIPDSPSVDDFDVLSDEDDEDEQQLCGQCEEKRLRNVLQELSNIENGYVELLDKLARNHSELEIRSQGRAHIQNEIKEREMSFLTEITNLNLNLMKLKQRKKDLLSGEYSSELQRPRSASSEDEDNFEINNLASDPSISRSKMNKIISNMKIDLEQRRKRMEILEECFGSGRTLESETKAQLGYLPSSIRYFPEKKTLKFLQFHDDDVDPESLELERDSADTFEEIMSRGRSQKSETSPHQSTPEVESLFQTSNSEIGDSSETDSNAFDESGVSGIILSSSELTQIASGEFSQNLTESYIQDDSTVDISEEPSASVELGVSSPTGADDEIIPENLDYSSNFESEDSEDCSGTGGVNNIESVELADLTSETTMPINQKQQDLISTENSPRVRSSRELKALAKGVPVNNLPENVKIPDRIRKLAQSILDINSNIARHEKELQLQRTTQEEESEYTDLDEMEIETEPEEKFEPKIPYYLLRSSLSSSSLDDPRDYSVIDFPLNRRKIPRPDLTTMKPQKINFEFDSDLSSLAIGQLKRDLGPVTRTPPKVVKKSTLKRISPRKTALGPVPRSKPILKPVSPVQVLQKPMSPLAQYLKKSRLKKPGTTKTKPVKTPRSKKLKVKTPRSPKIKTPRTKGKHSKATIASVLYPDRLEELQELEKKDAEVSVRVICREPFKICMLDLMDAIEQRKKSTGPKELGLSNIMDIKTLYKDIKKKEKGTAKAKSLLKDVVKRPVSKNPISEKVTGLPQENQRKNPKRHLTPIPIHLQPPPANYLKPCDRNPRNPVNVSAATFNRNRMMGPTDPNSSKVIKPVPVKQMPSYLRFGMFKELRGRNPSQNLKGSTTTKNNVTNLLLRGLVPEALSFSNANKNGVND